MNKFLAIFNEVFKLIPYVVAGINTIHAEKDSATKTQMAQDALNIATQAAAQVLSPEDQQIAAVASGAVSAGIQSLQAVHDAIATKPAAPVPAPPAA